ncbi:Osmolarity sensor protein EnvZ [Paraburkholderia caffeinitolerans]|uniref:histidine kinase n=1 Tax=Paraburkholderia caffeinitolerans TaxID=1723730 RepID=A0A6J5FNK5_9BURK|nr:ATP-binding protein [Paraburkholderia caffeinitolerans]CAB3783626.1 Osmolarity sensor protein EnvZ [Paraburkholderia caffeinitolerans]
MFGWYRSLLVRNVLALIVLVLANQIFAGTVYVFLVQRPRIEEAASLVAAQIRTVSRLLAALPPAVREQQLLAINGVSQSEVPGASATDSQPPGMAARYFVARMSSELGAGEQMRFERGGAHRVWVRLRVDDAYYWMLLAGAPHGIPSLPWTLISLLLCIATVPPLVAFLIHRPVERLLMRLARAADTIEQGAWPEAVPVEGAHELAMVADAFNRMAASLQELETTRAQMLAGISHDIRTPLTKLRMVLLAPESVEAPADSAERFVEEIDMIVQQFIDFARGWDSETARRGDLNALIERLAADYVGLEYVFDLSLEPLPEFSFRPTGMQRLLMNLMHNAAVHGRNGLAVRTRMAGGYVTIDVEDQGPGVPAELLPLMKQPFRQGPQSDQRSGSGLGLAIADRIARQHDGVLDLLPNRPHGLVARVRLPVR